MPDIVCPECGQISALVAIRRDAEEFCPHCDFPLFWAPTAVPLTTPGSSSEANLRRLPGAGGRRRIGSKVCPECGELNPLTETHCTRCQSLLDPVPLAPPQPVTEVFIPAPAPEPVPEPSKWIPWLYAAALCAGMIGTLILVAD